MTLAELLTSQRRWGRTRARKLLQSLGLSENKRLGTLTSRQRALLSSALNAKTGEVVFA
jgi:ribosomal protein S13